MAFVAEAGVHAGFGAGAVVAVAGVDGSFFGADKEGGWVRGGEGHAGGAEVVVFVWERGEELEVFLGLAEHVDCPAAYDAVCGDGDDVVGILGADDGDGVDGVGVTAR